MRYIDVDKYIKSANAHGHLGHDINGLRSQQLEAAIRAAQNAYCPYSKFHVGVGLLTLTANVYGGCNVENAGMSHAELTAITNAILHEGSDMLIMEMVVWAGTEKPCPSCGTCRQLICEHAASKEVKVWSFANDPTTPPLVMSVDELLPHSFGPENLS